MQEEILSLLAKLISFKSETPKGKDALMFIAELLTPLGFKCEIKDFGPNGEVSNLYAVYGNQAPNICFAGHVDVVPALHEDLWKFEPYKLNIQDGQVYGRGVVDMKGAIACFLAALQNHLEQGLPTNGSISLLLTTDEEGDAKYGTKEMLEHITKQGHKIDLCIVGEPTSEQHIGDIVKIGRRGSISFNININGRQGHVAYPHKAKNPAPIFSKFLEQLVSLKLDSGTEFFQPSNLEVTSIQTGQDVSNVIPQNIRLKCNIRFNDLHKPDELVHKIEKILRDTSDDYTIEHRTSALPFQQKISAEFKRVAKVIEQNCGSAPTFSTSGGTSDARFIHQYTQVLELGLKSDMAHKIDENCKNSDLQKLYDVYSGLLVEFIGSVDIRVI